MDKFLDTVKISNFCGFCSTGSHDLCKGMIRNGDLSLIQCACDCFETKTPRCTECHTTDTENLGRPWLCDDRDACHARIETRLANSETMQAIRRVQDTPRPPRPISAGRTAKSCLCCDQPTKGGRFLPGHDSKWLTARIAEIGGGTYTRAEQVARVAEISPALAVKLEKRLDGVVG